jgi:hypothetical protein
MQKEKKLHKIMYAKFKFCFPVTFFVLLPKAGMYVLKKGTPVASQGLPVFLFSA